MSERAAITQMGGFTPEGDPIGWGFDCKGDPNLVRHTMVAGRVTEIAGWTVPELIAMWHEARSLHLARHESPPT